MTDQSLDAARIHATALIVAAKLSGGYDAYDVDELITTVRRALEAPIVPEVVEPPVVALTPAVPVRKSITPDAIICLEDGKAFKSLKRHLRTAFSMTPDEYRARWSLPADYPMVAPNYSATRSKLAKDNGLGKKAA